LLVRRARALSAQRLPVPSSGKGELVEPYVLPLYLCPTSSRVRLEQTVHAVLDLDASTVVSEQRRLGIDARQSPAAVSSAPLLQIVD
jgi:hypothetical protein